LEAFGLGSLPQGKEVTRHCLLREIDQDHLTLVLVQNNKTEKNGSVEHIWLHFFWLGLLGTRTKTSSALFLTSAARGPYEFQSSLQPGPLQEKMNYRMKPREGDEKDAQARAGARQTEFVYLSRISLKTTHTQRDMNGRQQRTSG
jgi:hypothetical protein